MYARAGHPDVFDRMSAITMGGVSKACKGIHLSEDIFAGFNYVLRGGEATQADYIQARKKRPGVSIFFSFQLEGKKVFGCVIYCSRSDK